MQLTIGATARIRQPASYSRNPNNENWDLRRKPVRGEITYISPHGWAAVCCFALGSERPIYTECFWLEDLEGV